MYLLYIHEHRRIILSAIRAEGFLEVIRFFTILILNADETDLLDQSEKHAWNLRTKLHPLGTCVYICKKLEIKISTFSLLIYTYTYIHMSFYCIKVSSLAQVLGYRRLFGNLQNKAMTSVYQSPLRLLLRFAGSHGYWVYGERSYCVIPMFVVEREDIKRTWREVS